MMRISKVEILILVLAVFAAGLLVGGLKGARQEKERVFAHSTSPKHVNSVDHVECRNGVVHVEFRYTNGVKFFHETPYPCDKESTR